MKIDIVSDVVCPWCIVGYKQLEQALERTQTDIDIHWHPFELNPNMTADGQNLQEHIIEKYGITPEQSAQNREKLTLLGDSLGFEFKFNDESRMANTFKAHQLLHWAGLQSAAQEHNLKLAFFHAYFTEQKNIDDDAVLLSAVEAAGLDTSGARKALDEETYSSEVRQRESFWTDRGVSGVPAMVFEGKYLITGAQGVENYISIINQIKEKSSQTT